MLVFLVLHLLASCMVLASRQAAADDGLGETAQHRFNERLNRASDLDDEEYHSRFGPQADLPFSGPLSFAHLPYSRCLDDLHSVTTPFDIAILGMPFDTAVTYRPGARFGPYGIRSGSRRLWHKRAYSLAWGSTPYTNATKVVDCGDVPVTPFDNKAAVAQMEAAYSTLLARPVPENICSHEAPSMSRSCSTRTLALDARPHPRILTLGGDHAIVLPILRSLHKVYGPITVIHFDSHLDTWPVEDYFGLDDMSTITHGTFFWTAARENLLKNGTCIHAGIRCKIQGIQDISNDEDVGFAIISTDDIDDIGPTGIVQLIRDRVGHGPIYLSLDIDVIDPSLAPATGTPEPAGWTPRELHRIIRGLAGLNFVGVDIVEVAPAYDSNAETTSIIAAHLVHELLSMLIADGPPKGFRSRLLAQKAVLPHKREL